MPIGGTRRTAGFDGIGRDHQLLGIPIVQFNIERIQRIYDESPARLIVAVIDGEIFSLEYQVVGTRCQNNLCGSRYFRRARGQTHPLCLRDATVHQPVSGLNTNELTQLKREH